MIKNLITVIIPLYNTQDYVIKAINSIVNQTYKKWELILVNDCSTDNSHKVIIDKIKSLPSSISKKIKLIKNNKNYGSFVSTNRGIKASRGQFITILGSDDEFVKTKLAKQISILIKRKNIIAASSYFTRDGHLRNRTYPVTLMFRRLVIKRMGYFDSVRFGADGEFLRRLYKRFSKSRVHLIREVLYVSHSRPNSLYTSKVTGFNTKPRSQYSHASARWQNRFKFNKKKLFMPYPLKKRPFPIHKIQNPEYRSSTL